MADALRRELERRAQAGDAEDQAALLVRRVRSGEVSGKNLELAAFCGDPVAQLVLQETASLVYCTDCAGTGNESRSCGDLACCPDPVGAKCETCGGLGEVRRVSGPNNLPTDFFAFVYSLSNRGADVMEVVVRTTLGWIVRNRPKKAQDALAWRLSQVGETPKRSLMNEAEYVNAETRAMLHEEVRKAMITWALKA